MKDLDGGFKSEVVYKNGVFYAYNGTQYVEITTSQLVANVGVAAAGVIAQEYGTGYNRQTVLTIAQVAALTAGDNASLADGTLLYTFPAGEIVINSASMQIGLTNTEHAAETPLVGLGTVIGTGAVAVLSGTATFQNIITGTAVTGMVGQILTKTAIPTAGAPLVIADAAVHTVYLNMAVAWANTAGAALDVDLSGIVILNWSYLGNPA